MDWLRRFMAGRYGSDQLTMALIGLYAALYIIAQLIRWIPLAWIAVLLLVFVFYRMLSRNVTRRYEENQWFLRHWRPVSGWFHRLAQSVRDRKTHRYYKCPNCSSKLRVPKGKGKIQITCPVCRTEFVKKT